MMEIKERRLLSQNFVLLIILCVLSSLLTFPYDFYDLHAFWASALGAIINLILLFNFLKYLYNFNAKKAIYWTRYNMIVNLILWIIINCFTKLNPKHKADLIPLIGIMIIIVAGVILILYSTIKLGIGLQKIDDDFIGGLGMLGKSYVYLLPICLLARLACTIAKIHYLPILLLFDAGCLVPNYIMITIFLKARRYQLSS